MAPEVLDADVDVADVVQQNVVPAEGHLASVALIPGGNVMKLFCHYRIGNTRIRRFQSGSSIIGIANKRLVDTTRSVTCTIKVLRS